MIITLAIIAFALAAVLGLYLISYVMRNKNTPKGVAMIHGSIAALGIVLLVIYSIQYESPVISLILFIAAALGGFTLMYMDISGKKIPKLFAAGHGLIAISGFVLLLLFSYRMM